MMSNPFTAERQQQLQDKGLEFLESFGKAYAINFGKALFDKIAAEAEGKKEPKTLRKLKYRTWTAVERPKMFKGAAYMKSGKGQGDFGSWKQYYFVERKDYNIDYYSNEKDFSGGKKSKGTIMMGGYDVEDRPRQYYQKQWDNLKSSLNAADEETDPVGYSQYSWALTHQSRINYIFQLHKSKNPTCGCFGGSAVEPEDVGEEHENERRAWLDFMRACTDRAKDRDHKGVKGKAFDSTVKDMKTDLSTLKNYDGEGPNSEVLVTMLMLHVGRPIINDMLGELQGPFKLRVTAAFKSSSAIESAIKGLADPAWGKMEQATVAIQNTLEPKLKSSVIKLVGIKNTVKDKVKDKFLSQLGGLLDKHVSPYLKEAVHNFEAPAKNGFDSVKVTFETTVTDINGDPQQVAFTLDAIPRTGGYVKDITAFSRALVKPFSDMKAAYPEVFSHVNPNKIKAKTEKRMLKILDACIYTLEKKIKAEGNQNLAAYKAAILKDLEHDIQIERNRLVKDMVRAIFLEGVKRLFFEESPAGDALDMIPDEVAEFLNIKALLEDIIDFLIGEPIDIMIDRMYPMPDQEDQQAVNVRPAEDMPGEIQEHQEVL